jgi:tetratricopeptide (TPR) repeat protein
MLKRDTLIIILAAALLLAILLIGLALLNQRTKADSAAVSAANSLYESGHTAEAIQMYEQLLAQGVQDSTLFYNLGNAYYRQNDLDRAILNHEQAARLAPRDADVQANLALARAQAGLQEPMATGDPLNTLAAVVDSWFSLNELAMVALGSWFLLAFLLLLRGQRMRPSPFLKTATRLALVFTLLAGICLGSSLYARETRPERAITADVTASAVP